MQIKTYKGKHVFQPHFFILNKGNNCGKPLTSACANCFVCLVNTEEKKEFYYWLCFALWQTAKFEPYLVGSVIPFIHIKDVKEIIRGAAIKACQMPGQYQKSLALLMEVDKKYSELLQQLNLLSNLKKALLNKVLK